MTHLGEQTNKFSDMAFIYTHIFSQTMNESLCEGHSINKVNLSKKLAKRNMVYSCTFLKETNSYRFFHVLEDSQHKFLY